MYAKNSAPRSTSRSKSKSQSKQHPKDIKKIIGKGIEEFKKRYPHTKYSDIVVEMYFNHIISLVGLNKESNDLDDVQHNFLSFVDRNSYNMEEMISQYVYQVKKQLDCGCSRRSGK